MALPLKPIRICQGEDGRSLGSPNQRSLGPEGSGEILASLPGGRRTCAFSSREAAREKELPQPQFCLVAWRGLSVPELVLSSNPLAFGGSNGFSGLPTVAFCLLLPTLWRRRQRRASFRYMTPLQKNLIQITPEFSLLISYI